MYLPAEWEEQDGVMLAWPHQQTDWSANLERVVDVYLEVIRQISRYEKVLLISPAPEETTKQLQSLDIDLGQIIHAKVPTNDTWCRDYGPLTISLNNKPQLLDFGFNAWGLKFAADLDNQVNRRLLEAGIFGGTPMTTEGLILEGGSIDSDGQGTLLTTSRCLLGLNRNPHLNREELTARLKARLGARRILWLEHGWLSGDDTDAHIDTLVRFAPQDTLVHVACDDGDDEHFADLKAMSDELKMLVTPQGNPYRLLPLPWPKAVYSGERRLPASYANFLVINGAVLVPTYGDPADPLALSTLADAFPGREIIGIDSRPLIEQGGSLHCITMQLPRGVLS